MIDIPSLIVTATSAVGLFDKIADQVKRFINKEEPSINPSGYSMKIEKEGESLVKKSKGIVLQRLTASELEKLPEETLIHVKTLEKSMQNYYKIWSNTYPQLSLIIDPIQKSKIELSLRQEVLLMKNDFERILKFLEDCGFQLDDHYLAIRDALRSYS
jgi:hypothetical protein